MMERFFQVLMVLSLFCGVGASQMMAQSKMKGVYRGMYYGNGTQNGGNGQTDVEFAGCPNGGDPYGLDLDCLIKRIKESHANTYFYFFSGATNAHWNQFDSFLTKLATEAPGVQVYAYFVTAYSVAPFGWDFETWADELVNLRNLGHSNLVGMGFDDFDVARVENFAHYFNPNSMAELHTTLREGGLELLITAYHRPTNSEHNFLLNPTELAKYRYTDTTGVVRTSFDGVVYPVLYDSNGGWLLGLRDDRINDFPRQISNLNSSFSQSIGSTKIYTLLYATGYPAQNGAGNTSLYYLQDVARMAYGFTDGVVMYHLQTDYMSRYVPVNHMTMEKRAVISHLFARISSTSPYLSLSHYLNTCAPNGSSLNFAWSSNLAPQTMVKITLYAPGPKSQIWSTWTVPNTGHFDTGYYVNPGAGFPLRAKIEFEENPNAFSEVNRVPNTTCGVISKQ
ncbi:hypothetical protein SCOR_28685 [Sulfidibacter corallicola]